MPSHEDELLKTIVKQHSELRWPSDSISLGLLTPIESRDELFLVDMRMIVSHYWETIFRHGGDSNAVLPSWSESDKHAPLFAAMFGDYGDARPGPRFRQAFERGLRKLNLSLTCAGNERSSLRTTAATAARFTCC